MPHATAADGVQLYFEETGRGIPIIFSHEFAGDYRSWEAQVRFFSRRYRCITYSSRGYPNSDIPEDQNAYSQYHFRDDLIAVLDHLDIEKAHIVGLSMGAYSAVQVGLTYPERVRSLVLAAVGSGSEPDRVADFRKRSEETAQRFFTEGSAALAKTYGQGPTRVQFMNKDPRGYAEFAQWFAEHSNIGAGNTMRGFQGGRTSLWEYAAELEKMPHPALIVVGDEDEGCIRPSLYLKRRIPASGLVMYPKTGHCVSQEEPDLFNRTLVEFYTQVGTGNWPARDPKAEKTPMPGLPE